MRLSTPRSLAVLPLLALGAGCNSYDWFRTTGLRQEGFTNKADILFVIDNSPSMTDEAEALAVNFASFIDEFAEEPPDRAPTLTDEVGRFLEYVNDRTQNLNYSIGITTTDASKEPGQLRGARPFLGVTDREVPRHFRENLLCDAACVLGETSVGVTCPGGGRPGRQNCADSVQGASEEGIEPVFMALCRAVENPPEACFQEWYWWPSIPGTRSGRWATTPPSAEDCEAGAPGESTVPCGQPVRYFEERDVLSNDGWLREGSIVVPVVVTDEGDQSRRISGRTGEVFPYDQLFRQFNHRMTWAVIGPNLDCNSAGAAEWGVRRYQRLVEETGGLFLPIAVEERGECVNTDFGEALTQIGNLLRGLTDTFPLAVLPVPETIVVSVDGERIREARPTTGDDGITRWGDGWRYEVQRNAVILSGAAVPDFNADVRIWYLPASARPRDLPF